jgi:hypothetical protein
MRDNTRFDSKQISYKFFKEHITGYERSNENGSFSSKNIDFILEEWSSLIHSFP